MWWDGQYVCPLIRQTSDSPTSRIEVLMTLSHLFTCMCCLECIFTCVCVCPPISKTFLWLGKKMDAIISLLPSLFPHFLRQIEREWVSENEKKELDLQDGYRVRIHTSNTVCQAIVFDGCGISQRIARVFSGDLVRATPHHPIPPHPTPPGIDRTLETLISLLTVTAFCWDLLWVSLPPCFMWSPVTSLYQSVGVLSIPPTLKWPLWLTVLTSHPLQDP